MFEKYNTAFGSVLLSQRKREVRRHSIVCWEFSKFGKPYPINAKILKHWPLNHTMKRIRLKGCPRRSIRRRQRGENVIVHRSWSGRVVGIELSCYFNHH